MMTGFLFPPRLPVVPAMLFLLNDVVLSFDPAELTPPVTRDRFAKLSLSYVGELGKELFAEEPLLHRKDPERAARLAALIGPQRTKEMIFLAKLIDGPTALGIGLVSELLADAASLHARAEELARTVANHAPITLQVTKEALRRLQARLGDDDIDDLIRLAYGSSDFREGMAAFLAKRAPKWSGT